MALSDSTGQTKEEEVWLDLTVSMTLLQQIKCVRDHIKYQAVNPARAAIQAARTTWQGGCLRSVMANWHACVGFPLTAVQRRHEDENTEKRRGGNRIIELGTSCNFVAMNGLTLCT